GTPAGNGTAAGWPGHPDGRGRRRDHRRGHQAAEAAMTTTTTTWRPRHLRRQAAQQRRVTEPSLCVSPAWLPEFRVVTVGSWCD
ncbi:hypothetical protein, partial [Acetobacter fabarum]|uniref:hypothetical protein n=1 Tax=Acetobacter fabarum TaxID=483199 RepID=UPI001C54E009